MKSYYESKFNCIIKDYGMGGATTADILNNFSAIVKDNDDIVIVMLGTNDRRSVPLVTYIANLEKIVDRLLAMKKYVILMSPTPLGVTIDSQSQYFHAEDINNVVSAVAYKKGV